jgi:uncharacterized membrane protein
VKKFLRKTFGYFLQGTLLIAPVAITLYVIFSLLRAIDEIIPFDIPGLGIVVLFVCLTLVGLFGGALISAPLTSYFNELLNKAPLVKTIYTSIKDLLSAFVGKEKRFDQPVLVKLNKDSEVEKLGFITRKDLSSIGIGSEKIAVYLPHSYAFSGNLFIVPASNVTLINASSTDVMKFIVSGGVAQIEEGNGKTEEPNTKSGT